MNRAILICLCWSLVLQSGAQKLRFYSEDLTFRLNRDYFEVEGLYYFRNTSGGDLRQTLFYPFPDVERYGDISKISVCRDGDTTSMLIRQNERGALFLVDLKKDEEAAWHIHYRQQLKSTEAKYIVMTTHKWGEPFETAHYQLEVPDELQLTHISLQPDSIISRGSHKILVWSREDFMPEVDFEFRFE